jgi:iron complex transport system ATP-binding protein
VLLARALVGNPQILLLDEPLSNLDPYWVLRITSILETTAQSGQSVLVALHDLSQLPRFGRALLIADGKVQMDETPASLMASERFETVFRIQAARGGWEVRRQADRRSSR